MLRRVLLAVLAAACLVVPVAGQAAGDYLDVYIVNVKPEKVADFEALAKKMAVANRKYDGDRWLAETTMYGENNTYVFVSNRQTYADIDKGGEAFMSALNKAYGNTTAQKMLNEWNSCMTGARSELRRRRWDLSRKAPADAEAYAKLVGDSRVLRTTVVHVRPGRVADFEAILKDLKTAGEKAENTQTMMVSQAVEGTKGTTFYLTGLRGGLDGFDKNPTTREILGEDGYKKFLQDSAESVENTESMVYRFSPDLSVPPEQILAAAPSFWQPKTEVAATAKPKKGAEAPVQPAAMKEKQ